MPYNEIGISCITACYNDGDEIKNALFSSAIAANLHCDKDEVIVVDDGSDWPNAEKIREICHSVNNYFGKETVRLVVNDVNKGKSISRNIGIKEAKNNWICFLDADDVAVPYRNLVFEYHIKNYPDADIIYGDCFEVKDSTGDMRDWIAEIYQYGLLAKRSYLPFGAILMNRTKVDLFNEEMKVCEDYEWALRNETSGKKLVRTVLPHVLNKDIIIHLPLYVRMINRDSDEVKNGELITKTNNEIRSRYSL